ncbi:MAG TPA: protein kinase, partial [Gemmatimonadaceae bacterium]|nr:protein kinase [Gemmatimonadaceae bacterium]
MGDLAERIQRALGDGYEITDDLGGGMARVFVAREVHLGRDIVVKVLPPELGAGINIDRFRREIQVAARLQNPHIVPLLFAGSKDGLLYYAMPRVEGETLRARLQRSGELPISDTVRILRDVADALESAHNQGVVHRDIKPENILLSGYHALVTDFGIAKALTAATGDAAVTSHGMAIGTPAYMAPEQASGDPTTDQRADIYALGVVGYELLAGMTPFFGATPQQVLTAHIMATPAPVSRYRPNVPPSLSALIMRCLEKKKADRFQTAKELREQLEVVSTPSGGTMPTQAVPAETRGAGSGKREAVTGALQTESGKQEAGLSAPRNRKRTFALVGIAAVLLAGSLLASRYLTGTGPQFDVGETTQLTNESGLEITPAFSPDGRFLAYAAGEPGRTSIMVREVSGGDAIRVANGLAPQWSPDGSKLVYVDSAGIASVPVFGGTPQRLVQNPEKEYALSPVWSHDGKYLAYAHVLTIGGFGSIWIANADGTGAHKILDTNEPNALAWSLNDDRLAFVEGNLLFVYSGIQFGNIAPSTVWVV